MRFVLIFVLFLTNIIRIFSQTLIPQNGARDERQRLYAFTNATIFVDYKTCISQATLLVENTHVVQVGKNIPIPKHAKIVNLKGKYIHPSFIELHANYGIEANKPYPHVPGKLHSDQRGAYYWNEAVKSFQHAFLLYRNDMKSAESFLQAGFGTILTHQMDGLARGTSVLVALADKKENENILLQKAAAHFSFNRGSSTQQYPTSLMGCIAILRQLFYDATWFSQSGKDKELYIELFELQEQKKLPLFFDAVASAHIAKAYKIAEEHQLNFTIKGDGKEYQYLNELKNIKSTLIIPVNYPLPFDINDASDLEVISYKQLREWEMAPLNLSLMYQNGISFALTTDGLKDKAAFVKHLSKAIRYGLPYAEALKALTYTPAKLLGVEHKIGALKPGMLANFIISTDSIFKESATLLENWVMGEKYVVKPYPDVDFRAIYTLYLPKTRAGNADTLTFSITGKEDAPNLEIIKDSTKIKGSAQVKGSQFQGSFEWRSVKYTLSGWRSDSLLSGIIYADSDDSYPFRARIDMPFTEPAVNDSIVRAQKKIQMTEDSILKKHLNLQFPFASYGFFELPKQRSIVFKNATLWTGEKEGIRKQTDLWIQNGKIMGIGHLFAVKADTIIDATNLHITPGLIDEHSHIGISGGVNECSNSVTAEVRVGDVIQSDDINIFRNLSGGVVAAQLLHGSCNAIGGQSALVKFRWGLPAEEMKIKNADGFIKFALGENVKQSNWGDAYRHRFPQSRMGVEQVYRDAFDRAIQYENEWKNYRNSTNKLVKVPRKDLQLEAILEVIRKKRFITCHSYVQSEILMLMRLCETYGFTVNTFTHILEGYKIAPHMKNHGAGASSFSDWWAYKQEVKDAIPYNPALLHNAGVLTAINSDDAEMAKRLNHEAAKTIKYGNLSEEEALKMITIHPAKLLHIDHITGSIKVGKDADIVLWNDNPLSVYASVLQTYVDGRCYYDRNIAYELNKQIIADKWRIAKRMQEEKKKGAAVQIVSKIINHLVHCDDVQGWE